MMIGNLFIHEKKRVYSKETQRSRCTEKSIKVRKKNIAHVTRQ